MGNNVFLPLDMDGHLSASKALIIREAGTYVFSTCKASQRASILEAENEAREGTDGEPGAR